MRIVNIVNLKTDKIYVLDNLYIFIYKNNVMKNQQHTTSVKVDETLWEDFKVSCVKHKFSLQKLAERTIHLYLTDEEFRKSIHNHNNLDR
jgi:hypothetical protein